MREHSEEIAVQLYSLRQVLADDVEGCLARVAELGYRGVELAGWANQKPEHWSDLLLQYHLTPVGMHVGYEQLDDNVERVIAEASVIGAPVIVVPAVPAPMRKTEADWMGVAGWLNRIGEHVRQSGKRLAYHNHWFEFDILPEGGTGFDRLVNLTDPSLVEFEVDLYWATWAGQSVPELVRRLGRRMTLCHLKDMTAGEPRTFAPVGQGILPWREWLPLLDVESWIVEQDECAESDPFSCIEVSIHYLTGKA